MGVNKENYSKCQPVENIYVASCTEDGGIFHYKLIDGNFILKGITQMDRPMYMIIENQKMYIVLRAPFGNEESGVVVYDLAADGTLMNPSAIMSTKGEVACHITVHREKIYCANYISGSVIMLPDTIIKHEGKGINPKRQEGPHVHYVGMTPDDKYLCVADLGLDTIFLYYPDMTLHSRVKVLDGHGVRHLAFSEDGKYLFAVNELKSTVTVFAYSEGELELLDVCSVLPQEYKGESIAAAIKIKDDDIYVSNRGHDSVTVLGFQNNKLVVLEHISCGGKSPRDFAFAGDYLLSANQDEDTVTILNMSNEYVLENKIEIKTPICICVL